MIVLSNISKVFDNGKVALTAEDPEPLSDLRKLGKAHRVGIGRCPFGRWHIHYSDEIAGHRSQRLKEANAESTLRVTPENDPQHVTWL